MKNTMPLKIIAIRVYLTRMPLIWSLTKKPTVYRQYNKKDNNYMKF